MVLSITRSIIFLDPVKGEVHLLFYILDKPLKDNFNFKITNLKKIVGN